MEYMIRVAKLGDKHVLSIFDFNISNKPLWSSLHDTEEDAYGSVNAAKETLSKHEGVADRLYKTKEV